jgi:hypothetical protein
MRKIVLGFLGVLVALPLLLPQSTFAALSPDTQPIPTKIVIQKPYPYQDVQAGSSFVLRWQVDPRVGQSLNLYYGKNDGVSPLQTIQQNVPNGAGVFVWSVPGSLESGEYNLIFENTAGQYREYRQIKVTGREQSAEPPANPVMQIIGDKRISITSPNGGESYHLGDTILTEWTHSGMGNEMVTIYLGVVDKRGITKWSPIASQVPGNWDRYGWHVNREIIAAIKRNANAEDSNKFKIMVVSPKTSLLQDTSDSYFTIDE